ncbi:MAG: hypothetical protein FWH57_05255 [Oscillospiraceae bacterium]|nr:hypothetical protein [Oscillospiraceae bacterium]
MAVKSLEDLNKEFMSESLLNNSYSDKQQSEDLSSKPQVESKSLESVFHSDDVATQNDNKQSRRFFRRVRTPKVREIESSGKRKARPPKERKTKRNRGVFARIMDIFFLLVLLLALISVFTSTSFGNEASRKIFGYSLFTAASSSTKDEIPKDSLIVARRIEPYNLVVGDNITFTRADSAHVAHQITDIYENYLNSGYRGFMTRGVNNTDVEIVREEDVVGRVVLSLPVIGGIMSYLQTNNNIVLIILGLFIGSFVTLNVVQWVNKTKTETETDTEERAGAAPAPQTMSTPQERSPVASG